MKRGFTLFELVAVIIVTAILIGISTQIIFNLYQNYAQNRIINELESKSELVVEQISKLLSLRIKDSLIARKMPPSDDFTLLQGDFLNDKYQILEWLAASYEAMISTNNKAYIGGYSGFVDIDNNITKKGKIVEIFTPKSDLDSASRTMNDLTNGVVNLENGRAGLFFKGFSYNSSDKTYIQNAFGYDMKTNLATHIFIAQKSRDEVLKISKNNDLTIDKISEQYELLHTAYAIVPSDENTTAGDFTLNLHYNYQPWSKTSPNNYKESKKAILVKNVTQFAFKQSGDEVIIKLCLRAIKPQSLNNKNENEIVVCKSEVVY